MTCSAIRIIHVCGYPQAVSKQVLQGYITGVDDVNSKLTGFGSSAGPVMDQSRSELYKTHASAASAEYALAGTA